MAKPVVQPSRPWIDISLTVPKFKSPSITSLLALGFLSGCLLYTPMIAILGRHIDPIYREDVKTIAGLFKDGMLLILGFYFAKVVNTGQENITNRAFEVAQNSQPKTPEEPLP